MATERPQWIPDGTDWTWVLERRCGQCGEDVTQLSPGEVGRLAREAVFRWSDALDREDAELRPDAYTWSAVEYAAHVADLLEVMAGRLRLMLDEDGPVFPDWDQDRAAFEGGYSTRSADEVMPVLEERAEAFAAAAEALSPGDFGRTGRRGNGTVFTVETLLRYAWHDVAHHLHDVGS